MLIAQARVAQLSLVTADEAAARYGDFVLLVR
jgi:PIN domain nuclease of toxin-antitoxin system